MNGCRITLSNKEIRHKKISKIDAVLFDFLKLHKVQTKPSSPIIPEDTRIVRKLELKVAPECIESFLFT